jgi:hypothetical protein
VTESIKDKIGRALREQNDFLYAEAMAELDVLEKNHGHYEQRVTQLLERNSRYVQEVRDERWKRIEAETKVNLTAKAVAEPFQRISEKKITLPPGLGNLLERAEMHGKLHPAYEVVDLRMLLTTAWTMLTGAQRAELIALAETELPG